MTDPWQILRDGGVPLALPTSGLTVRADNLAAATRAAIAGRPTGRDADALAAWILAWQQHWPQSFTKALGADATEVNDWVAGHPLDANRYLKLRRIALENLAKIL